MRLKPFFNYFGSKYRLAKYYPEPKYPIIIEPFAGAAGYSVWHSANEVALAEKDDVSLVWQYLITANTKELEELPLLSEPDEDIRTWRLTPAQELLIAWNLSCGDPRPRFTLNGFAKKYRSPFPGNAKDGRGYENFWGEKRRARIARQATSIRHWAAQYRDYRELPNIRATWFIDPPYARSGKLYRQNGIDYTELAEWCRTRKGQVIVCEQAGATWLPFEPFRGLKRGGHGQSATARQELVWTTG